jgi:hypothetical protein
VTDVVRSLLPALDIYESWLHVSAGRPSEEGWVTLDQILTPGDRSLDELLAKAGDDPRRPRQLVARSVFGWMCFCFLTPQVLTLSQQGRIPDLDGGTIWWKLGSESPCMVAWDTARATVLEDDPLAGEDGVTTLPGIDDLYEALVGWAVDTLEPLLEAVRDRVRAGRNGLWGSVTDFFAEIGPQSEEPDPLPGLDRLARFERAAAGTPVGQRIPLIHVPRPDGERVQTGRAGCCLYYKEPADPDEQMPEYLQGPWARYCTTCPLIPEEEAVRRLNWHLDHAHEKENA